MKVKLPAACLLFILILTSCASFQEIKITNITNFNITKLSAEGIEGEIKAVINNPNSTGFKVFRSKATVMLGDAVLGTAHLKKKVRIPANSNSEHTFILKGNLKDMGGLGMVTGLLTGKGKQIEVKGYIRAGKFIIRHKFPIDQKQKMSGLNLKTSLPGF